MISALLRKAEGRIQFDGFQVKRVDGWVGYYLGDYKSYLSGIWREVYVCPLPFCCFKFQVFCPRRYLSPDGIKKGDQIEVHLFGLRKEKEAA